MASNLILTGGIFHPFETAAPALAELLSEVGIDSVVRWDVDEALAEMADGAAYDLVTVYALRWRMLDHEKYEPYRAEWAMSLSSAARTALSAHVRSGGGLLGLHTATICFDDWPEWPELLGGRWVWGRSHHPPVGPVQVRLDTRGHPLTRGLDDFSLQDEVYHHLDMVPDAVALATADNPEGEGPQTVIWAHTVDSGRVVYDALGHDAAALRAPVHSRILQRAAAWATGRSDKQVEAI
ncbi:MAG: ThuA domain-containing protein [Alphaproteobacteria bacterium]|nr:MAG: ThuA domain-containing protein [Alphaproteobacteria bacterium]